MSPRPMGRPASTSEKLSVYLPEDLKKRLAIAAIRRSVTISALVETAVREYLKRGKDDE
jgi:hypothetical protein